MSEKLFSGSEKQKTVERSLIEKSAATEKNSMCLFGLSKICLASSRYELKPWSFVESEKKSDIQHKIKELWKLLRLDFSLGLLSARLHRHSTKHCSTHNVDNSQIEFLCSFFLFYLCLGVSCLLCDTMARTDT